jgi:hypothetical protein
MGRRRQDRPDPVPGREFASFRYDRHDAGPEAWPGRVALQAFLQSGLEAVDEEAGRAEAGELERRRGAEHKHRAKRKAFEVEPDRHDVLAEISGADFVPGPLERIEQFVRHEMDLPEVGRLCIAARQVATRKQEEALQAALLAALRVRNGKTVAGGRRIASTPGAPACAAPPPHPETCCGAAV